MRDIRTARRALLLAAPGALLAAGSSSAVPSGETLPPRTRRDTDDVAEKAAPLGTLAQQEFVLNLVDFVLESDDTVLHPATGARVRDHTQAMRRALDVAMSSGAAATLCIPSGSFVMAPFVIDRPVRILSAGTEPARFGTALRTGGRAWGGTTLVRRGTEGTPFVTVRANGVTIQSLTFDGAGSNSTILHVEGASELRVLRTRLANAHATGLLIDHTFNSVFDTVFVNNCGAAGGTASVVVNSSPPDKDGSVDPSRTNSVDFRCLTIEQNRDAALDIGVDPAKNRADRHQYPEYLRFLDLHIESSNYTGDDDGFLPTSPTVRVGVLNSATLTAPMIYGGPGPLIRQDAGSDTVDRSAGLTVVGGVLRGQIKSVRPTPTLVELVKGDEFRMIGTRFTQYTGPAISVASTFGPTVHVDPSTALGSAAGTSNDAPPVLDHRADGCATTRRQVFGTTELIGPVRSRARPVDARAISDAVRGVELFAGSNEQRGRIVITTSVVAAAGTQVSLVLPENTDLTDAASAWVVPSDAATARLRPYVQLRTDRHPNELWLAFADTPAVNSRYGFYYGVLG